MLPTEQPGSRDSFLANLGKRGKLVTAFLVINTVGPWGRANVEERGVQFFRVLGVPQTAKTRVKSSEGRLPIIAALGFPRVWENNVWGRCHQLHAGCGFESFITRATNMPLSPENAQTAQCVGRKNTLEYNVGNENEICVLINITETLFVTIYFVSPAN